MRDYQAAIAQPGNVGIRKPQELLHTLSVHRIVHLGLITPIPESVFPFLSGEVASQPNSRNPILR